MRETELREALRLWAARSGCRLCVLFGSRAREGPRVKGDVDVAVSLSPMPPPRRRLAMIGELQQVTGRDDVDLVFLHEGTDPVLRFEIFRTGELVFERRAGLFIDEKVRALMLYEDSLPFRRRRREKLRRLARGNAVVS